MLSLPDDVAQALVAHAREAAPEECCGLLLGTLLGGATTVTAARPARNIAVEPTRHYRLDPLDHLQAVRHARARHLEVVGGYHSHPRSAARPSPTDAAQAFSHFVFLIVGFVAARVELTAWKWVDGNFTPMVIVRP